MKKITVESFQWNLVATFSQFLSDSVSSPTPSRCQQKPTELNSCTTILLASWEPVLQIWVLDLELLSWLSCPASTNFVRKATTKTRSFSKRFVLLLIFNPEAQLESTLPTSVVSSMCQICKDSVSPKFNSFRK
jgi:hypothetical protein